MENAEWIRVAQDPPMQKPLFQHARGSFKLSYGTTVGGYWMLVHNAEPHPWYIYLDLPPGCQDLQAVFKEASSYVRRHAIEAL